MGEQRPVGLVEVDVQMALRAILAVYVPRGIGRGEVDLMMLPIVALGTVFRRKVVPSTEDAAGMKRFTFLVKTEAETAMHREQTGHGWVLLEVVFSAGKTGRTSV